MLLLLIRRDSVSVLSCVLSRVLSCVLTDWNGNPLGLVQEVSVEILPYNQVPWSMAEKEGEDESLESWRANHDEFFQEDADIMGYEFKPDMLVVFEEFRLVTHE